MTRRDATGEGSIEAKALELLEAEPDAKNRRKYGGEWKAKTKSSR